MNLRIQRLFGARKPVYRAIARSLSTVHSVQPSSSVEAAPLVPEAIPSAEAQDGSAGTENSKKVKTRMTLSGTKSLSKLYRVGGKLKRAEEKGELGREWDPADSSNGGVPTFGEKYVPVQWGRSATALL